jgi:hypothetical protein
MQTSVAQAAITPEEDALAAALLAAELNQPFALEDLPGPLIRELFQAMPQLRVSVPFAAMRLLQRLATHGRNDIRFNVARALPYFADLYPDAVEQALLPLACDSLRKVRGVAAEALADLLEVSPDPRAIIARWQRQPEKAREVLERARQSLRPPLAP